MNLHPLPAIVVAGGLSRRLDGVAKASLRLDGVTLVRRAVQAAQGQAHAGQQRGTVVVVGPPAWLTSWLAPLPQGVSLVQEEPAHGGPAAGLAAGLALVPPGARHVLVLACDLVHAAQLVPVLEAALGQAGADEGVIAVDGGRTQPLAAIYPVAPLRAAVATARTAHRLSNASVHSLLAKVKLIHCDVPDGLTADIDTWADARAHGAGPS